MLAQVHRFSSSYGTCLSDETLYSDGYKNGGNHLNQVHYPTTSINITEREAEISIEVDNTYHHALGGMHGSVYFKLLDDAAFFAASSVINDVFVLTSNFNIHFFRPHATGKIIAQGKVEHVTKNVIVASSTLYNDYRTFRGSK